MTTISEVQTPVTEMENDVFDENKWDEEKLQRDREMLSKLAQKLIRGGMIVHWGADSHNPSLIVDRVCSIRLRAEGQFLAKFWLATSDTNRIRAKLISSSDNKVYFADTTFYDSVPRLGEEIQIDTTDTSNQ